MGYGLPGVMQIDPMLMAAMGSMTNTLPADGSNTSSDGLDQQIQQQIAQRAKDAAAAASQAGSQYQQAAAQPAPQQSPLGAGLGSLFGNVASQLTQNPNYMQEAHQNIRDQQATLAQNRLQNLQALKDQADQKARAAEQLGNTEVAGLARLQSEKMAGLIKGINEEFLQALIGKRQKDVAAANLPGQQGLVAQRGEEARKTKQTQGAAPAQPSADPTYLQTQINTTGAGNKFLDLTNIPVKDVHGALDWAAQNGVPAVNKNGADHLRRIQTARDNIDTMLSQAEQILPADPQQRIAQYGNRKMSTLLQTSDARAAWGTWRISAIQQLTGLAGGMGSGLRINQAEINAAIKNDIPTLNDTYAVALKKANNVRTMLDHTEGPLIQQEWGRSLKTSGHPAADPLGVR